VESLVRQYGHLVLEELCNSQPVTKCVVDSKPNPDFSAMGEISDVNCLG